MSTTNIWILPTCGCFRCLQVDLIEVIFTDAMEHVLTPPSRGQISVRTGNNLKHIDSRDPHQVLVPSRALDDIIDVKQNVEGAIGLGLTIASVAPLPGKTQGNLLAYKPECITYQVFHKVCMT